MFTRNSQYYIGGEAVNFLLCMSGASGAVYFDRFIHHFPEEHELSICSSPTGKTILKDEIGKSLKNYNYNVYEVNNFKSSFASGSALWDGVIVCPCSMGTLGRIASGIADTLVTRAADVALKEKRKLILVTREMPLNLIQIRNMAAVTEAGGVILPASPSFYGKPQTITELADTVIARVFDQLGINNNISERWK